jgi:hypothetical protein
MMLNLNRNWLPESACASIAQGSEGEPSALEAVAQHGNQYSVVDCLSFGGFGLAAVFAIEPLDAAGGVYELLLAGKKRMAIRAYLETNL